MAFPTGYTLYQEVTIDNTKVTADLTDFVVYVDLSDMAKAGADIFDSCRSDGGDIRVTKSDGTTQLAREVVAINTGSGTGQLWFKFSGTLSSSSDTTIRIWYNGTDTEPATTATYGRNNVWTGFEMVLHLEEDPSGTAPQITDSTGNGNDGTTTGSMVSGDLISAKITNGLDFDGTDDGIEVDDATGLKPTSALTFSAWTYFNTTGGVLGITEKNRDSAWGGWRQADNTFLFRAYIGGALRTATSTTTTSTSTWYHYAATAQTDAVNLYIDGASDGSATGSFSTIGTNTQKLKIGKLGRLTANDNWLNGRLDEVRFASSALSSDWFGTEYNNQNSASTFYSVSDEQGGGGGTVNNAIFAFGGM